MTNNTYVVFQIKALAETFEFKSLSSIGLQFLLRTFLSLILDA